MHFTHVSAHHRNNNHYTIFIGVIFSSGSGAYIDMFKNLKKYILGHVSLSYIKNLCIALTSTGKMFDDGSWPNPEYFYISHAGI